MEPKKENINSAKNKLKLIIEDCAGRCSIHGVINIKENKSYFFKISWLVLMLGSFGFCCYLVINSIMSYLEYDVTTKIKIMTQIPIKFPIVKICDLNFYSTDYAKQQASAYFNSTGVKNPRNVSLMSKFLNKSDMYSILNYAGVVLRTNTLDLDPTNQWKYTVQFNQLLFACTISDVTCSANDFVATYDTFYGFCNTFNPNYTIQVYKSGPFKGLDIELLLPDPESYYLDIFQGLRIFIGMLDLSFFFTRKIIQNRQLLLFWKKNVNS
jgi:hypothetical protein